MNKNDPFVFAFALWIFVLLIFLCSTMAFFLLATATIP